MAPKCKKNGKMTPNPIFSPFLGHFLPMSGRSPFSPYVSANFFPFSGFGPFPFYTRRRDSQLQSLFDTSGTLSGHFLDRSAEPEGPWRHPEVLNFALGVECGENLGRTGGAQKNRGRTGGIWEENRGRTGGEAGALGQEPGENRGEGIFFETRDPTRDLKINEQDRP